MEKWKPVKGYKGRHEVSNLGRVRNQRTGRILRQRITKKGYRRVNIYANGKAQTSASTSSLRNTSYPTPTTCHR